MTDRTVTISGYPEGIANGVMLIQRIMEDRYNEVDNIEFERPPLNVMTTQTNVKIVLPDYIVDNIVDTIVDFIVDYIVDYIVDT